MFSTDKNIETIGQLIALIKKYIGLQGEYLKLDITEKVVRLITALLLFFILLLILIAILTYVSFAAAFAIANTLGNSIAFAIIAFFYILIFIFCLAFKKKLIEKPLVKFIACLLIDK